jgi:uncharacterized protein YpmB
MKRKHLIKSSKWLKGIYHRELANGDLAYYITYKLKSGKRKWLCVGKKSEGITKLFCSQLRSEVKRRDEVNNETKAL